jgi:aspartate/methionine/tyrosine aminotransferase
MKFKVASRLDHIREYYFSKKLREIAQLREAGANIINLGIGSPDMRPSDEVIDQLCVESKKSSNHGYQSYRGIPELRHAFADWYKTHFQVDLDPESEILPLIGSKEGIIHISMTYLEEGDEVLVPNPGYPAYRAAAQLAGATVIHYRLAEENGWLPKLNELAQQDLSKVKVMWVNYPHMPSGVKANFSFFEELVSFGKKHQILICHDNPYAFILNNEPLSLLKADPDKDTVLELTSLSKTFNMAGWRVGALAGHPQRINDVLKFKSNMDSGMFRPVQISAVQALQLPDSWYQHVNDAYKKRRAKAEELLDVLNCHYDKNQVGMFVWARIPASVDSGVALSDNILYKAHVFLTPGEIFGDQGKNFVRVSLCTPVELFDEAISRCRTMVETKQ